MKTPAPANDEDERLKILDDLRIVYSPSEERFDRVTRLAKRIFNVPIVAISLITSNTQWFKSSQGLTVCETTREVSFCGHAILGEDTFIIPDTTKDDDFSDNPLVIDEPFIRFYAGHPIHFNSTKLGTICIIDTRPRRFTLGDIDTLKSLALWVENELKLSLYKDSQQELVKQVGVLTRKSLVDTVTGCWNQRGMDTLLEKELSRAHRKKHPVSLLIVDVENTSKISGKKLSYKLEDFVLKEVAQRLRRDVRSHDIVGKLSGGQFMVFLSDIELEVTKNLIKRILRNLAINPLKFENDYVTIKANIGCTTNEDTNIWSSTLIEDTAKKALTQARSKNIVNSYHILKPSIEEHL